MRAGVHGYFPMELRGDIQVVGSENVWKNLELAVEKYFGAVSV